MMAVAVGEINLFTTGGLWSIRDMQVADVVESGPMSPKKNLIMLEDVQGTRTNRALVVLPGLSVTPP
jgi:hypothetical protein